MAPTQRSVYDRDSSTVVISQFVKEWPFEAKYYEKAARLASKLCEILLAEHAIQAVVTYSVKKSHRLDAKLRERVWKRGSGYDTFEDIRTDIVDLAGVRIAVYFPSDKKKILRMIDGDFCEVKSVEHPKVKARDLEAKQRAASTFSQETYQRRFDGYAADHYRVEMKVDRLAKLADGDLRKWLRSSKPRIEIQVVSVLMHAWAEVEHDLAYKALTSGTASTQEFCLLDAINGVVHTGEVLLQQLRTAIDARVEYQNQPFSDQYELRSFLRTHETVAKPNGMLDHLNVLYQVLKTIEFDSPMKLRSKLSRLSNGADPGAPAALTLLEHILHRLPRVLPNQDDGRAPALYCSPITVNGYDLDDRVLDLPTQRKLLYRAVKISDILRFPEMSMLAIEGAPSEFYPFLMLYNQMDGGSVTACKDLWMWFEEHDNVLFRVSLKIARLNRPEIMESLTNLHPSSDFQRLRNPGRGLYPPEIPETPIHSDRRDDNIYPGVDPYPARFHTNIHRTVPHPMRFYSHVNPPVNPYPARFYSHVNPPVNPYPARFHSNIHRTVPHPMRFYSNVNPAVNPHPARFYSNIHQAHNFNI